MELERETKDERPGDSAGTLGEVLYAARKPNAESEQAWANLVRRIGTGDQLALHSLYERTYRIVFTLIMRIAGNRETAEEVTLDVYHDVWRRAAAYDPANGTVVGWIMNQARSRAIDRLRFETRKKRNDAGENEPPSAFESESLHDILEVKEDARAVHQAMARLTAEEREAIEAAFFLDLTHAEVAARLRQPLGTVKTRIRSGLQKLRAQLSVGNDEQGPSHE